VESVEVSLERASADIRLRPGNRVTLQQLRQIVKKNGFSPQDAGVTVEGTLLDRSGKPAVAVTGTDIVWVLTSPGTPTSAYLDAVQRIKTQQSESIEAVGTVAVPRNASQPEELVLRELKPAAK
jgi:hypothetical protein